MELQQKPSASVVTDSVLDAIREGFDDPSEDAPKHLDLPVPLRKGIGLRFHAIDRDLYDEFVGSSDRDTNLDFIAAACECVVIPDGHKHDGSPKWRPAFVEGTPVKLDGSLAAVMGWTVGSPREEVLKVFAKVPLPYLAVAEHVSLVQAWMAGRAEQREEAVLGES